MFHAEVRVKGVIEPTWIDWFADLVVVSSSPDETVLAGDLPDLAALYGLLARLKRSAVRSPVSVVYRN